MNTLNSYERPSRSLERPVGFTFDPEERAKTHPDEVLTTPDTPTQDALVPSEQDALENRIDDYSVKTKGNLSRDQLTKKPAVDSDKGVREKFLIPVSIDKVDLKNTNKTEQLDPEHKEIRAQAVAQVEQAMAVVRTKIERHNTERGFFGRFVKALKERVLKMEAADAQLKYQLADLQALRSALDRNDIDPKEAITRVSLRYGEDMLVVNTQQEAVLTQVKEAALQDQGKVLTDAQANRQAQAIIQQQESLERQFFADGDLLNREADESAAQAAAQTQYDAAMKAAKTQERSTPTQADIKKELNTNQDLALEKTKGNAPGLLSDESKLIRNWFDQGTRQNVIFESGLATIKREKVYSQALERGAQSLRAQTIAFEKFLRGKLSPTALAKKLEEIRGKLGPGMIIDYEARGGADYELASRRIIEQLHRSTTITTFDQYTPSQLELYRLNDNNDNEIGVVIPGEHRLLVLQTADLQGLHITQSDIAPLPVFSHQELQQYVTELPTTNPDDIETDLNSIDLANITKGKTVERPVTTEPLPIEQLLPDELPTEGGTADTLPTDEAATTPAANQIPVRRAA